MKNNLLLIAFLFIISLQGNASDITTYSFGTGDSGKEALISTRSYTIISQNEVRLDAFRVYYHTRPVTFYCPDRVVDSGVTYEVTEIGSQAYSGNGCWTGVEIPASVTKIASDFLRCSYISYCWVSLENPVYKSVDGALLSKDGKTIFYIPQHNEEYVVPEGVEHINDYAGYGIYREYGVRSKLVLPASLQSIGKESLKGGYGGVDTIQMRTNEPPQVDESTFSSTVYGTTTLLVPDGSLQAYLDDPIFGNFVSILAYDSNGNLLGLDAPLQSDCIQEAYSPAKGFLLLKMGSDCSLPLYRIDGILIRSLDLQKGENIVTGLSSGCYLLAGMKLWVE